jgi:hypothetical protein
MSEAGPLLRSRRLWAERENKCLATLDRALSLLRATKNLPTSEVDLNRHLYFCLLAANRELYPDNEIAPITECNNQPDPDDMDRAAREQKRPDFQWVYIDRYETDPHRSSKQFVVECKRLGNSFRNDWVLNLNYVNHGIIRFRDPNWAYAQGFRSGAMVGYWQNLDATQVLTEINAEARRNTLPELVLIGAWKVRAVSRLSHSFQPLPQSGSFVLHHLWIDLRPQAP